MEEEKKHKDKENRQNRKQSPILIKQPKKATHRREHNSREKKRHLAKCYKNNKLLLIELEKQKRLIAGLRQILKRERKKTKNN